jgi:hypothetical protein
VATTSIADANRTYFRALANTRGSLGNFAGLGIPVVIILGALTMGMLDPSAFEGQSLMRPLFNVNVVVMAACALGVFLSMFKRLTYRFQVLFSTLLTGIALALVYSLCLMALAIAAFLNAGEIARSIVWFILGGWIAVAVLAGSTAAHILMLRRRLRAGHSAKRTVGNYLAVSGSGRSKMLWVIFAVVTVVPNVLTLGQYFANSLGAAGLVLFACVTPSLPVEFAYLAYLKSRDRVYWEARPRRMPLEERRRVARKVVLWVTGIAVALTLFWVCAKYVRF